MLSALTSRDEWKFASLLPKAEGLLASLWWILLIARGLLPALFAVAMGMLIAAVQSNSGFVPALFAVGVLFVLVQILSPLHLAVSQNLGSKMSALLYDRLTMSCVEPEGMGHLENPEATKDLAMARDFDLGISGPPLYVAMDFIAAGLVEFVAGVAAACLLFFYAWWAPLLVGGAWLSTHYLLRESGVWKDRNTDEVRMAQRYADYAYQVAVNPPAAKELRLFGLPSWIVERFRRHRRHLHDLRWEATRLREKPVAWSLLVVLLANAIVFASMGHDAVSGVLPLDRLVIFGVAAMSTSMIAFGGLSWAVDGASAPPGAVLRLKNSMRETGGLPQGTIAAEHEPERQIEFRGVSFTYPNTEEVVLDNLSLRIPTGSSIAIVGQNGAGKTTLAKLLCRLYDPQSGSISIDDRNLQEYSIASWRNRVTAVFQDFMRLEWSLRDNVDPTRTASDTDVLRALVTAGAHELTNLSTTLSRAYQGGTDLSGGQWQRVVIARALCAVYQGAGVVLLDEPTAQLDVRAETEIFDRVLEETKDITTILISHRFSTVRKADTICVLEHGKIIEMGSHRELMDLGGRYQTMFSLQASRFVEDA